MSRARVARNRLATAGGLLIGLPAIAVAGRISSTAGRALALRLIRALARVCGVRFEVTGAEQLHRQCRYVFVANHGTPIDIPAMLAARPDVRFLAAADLYRVPLLASAMRALDTVAVDRRSPRVARRQLRELATRADSLCLVVFPQGGIRRPGEGLRFKSGAFDLAIAGGATVVPVAIHGAAHILPPRARLGVRPGVVRIDILPPIPTAGLTAADRRALRDRAEAEIARSLAESDAASPELLRSDQCHPAPPVGPYTVQTDVDDRRET